MSKETINMTDHDMLIRLNERFDILLENMVTQKDIDNTVTTALERHCHSRHPKKAESKGLTWGLVTKILVVMVPPFGTLLTYIFKTL